jgi:hypothetical protein
VETGRVVIAIYENNTFDGVDLFWPTGYGKFAIRGNQFNDIIDPAKGVFLRGSVFWKIAQVGIDPDYIMGYNQRFGILVENNTFNYSSEINQAVSYAINRFDDQTDQTLAVGGYYIHENNTYNNTTIRVDHQVTGASFDAITPYEILPRSSR